METTGKTAITVEATVNAPIEKVWHAWNNPQDIMQWNNASDDWHTPAAENDLRTGGNFVYRMEAKDGSLGFDFGGVYDDVRNHESIAYTLGDGRKVTVKFADNNGGTQVTETFEAENINSHDLQKGGWQAILDNFKKHVEGV